MDEQKLNEFLGRALVDLGGAVNASRQPAAAPSLNNGKVLAVHAAQGGQ